MSINNSVLAQYEKNKTTTGGNENRMSEQDRMKRYFTTFLPKGEKQGEKRLRILPTKDGSTPFKEVLFHEIKVDGVNLKIYDPAQEGKRSPLNEIYEGLRLSGDPQDKEQAKGYRARKFFIVKVIDRDNEQDGPKFWRFKHSFKNDGIFDKIVPLFKKKGDITDKDQGIDLTLILNSVKSNNGNDYTSVTSIMPEDRSPLHEDAGIAQTWIDDELSWEDVYSKKSEDYLVLVAEGKTPKYDQNINKWVAKDEEAEYNFGQNNGGTGMTAQPTETPTNTVDPQSGEDEDDDLPF